MLVLFHPFTCCVIRGNFPCLGFSFPICKQGCGSHHCNSLLQHKLKQKRVGSLLCACCFAWIKWFYSHSNIVGQLLLSPFYRWAGWVFGDTKGLAQCHSAHWSLDLNTCCLTLEQELQTAVLCLHPSYPSQPWKSAVPLLETLEEFFKNVLWYYDL